MNPQSSEKRVHPRNPPWRGIGDRHATEAARIAGRGLSLDVGGPSTARVTLSVPEEVLDSFAARLARLSTESATGLPDGVEPWIGVAEAARHLDCPPSRLYRLVSLARGGRQVNPLPFEKDGARLLFKRSALDAWVTRGGATP